MKLLQIVNLLYSHLLASKTGSIILLRIRIISLIKPVIKIASVRKIFDFRLEIVDTVCQGWIVGSLLLTVTHNCFNLTHKSHNGSSIFPNNLSEVTILEIEKEIIALIVVRKAIFLSFLFFLSLNHMNKHLPPPACAF